ncbi:MAG: formimidoylglutamate deiminase, partial [Alphaproteobacteria bacterium]|nr:formimidoylglutamate deiminase [Alphaproteobacteria bacterium]
MQLFAESALLPEGWARNVLIQAGPDGTIAAVTPNAPPLRVQREGLEKAAGPVVPGMPNLHSHAFQRAMTGLAEQRGDDPENDDFWSWRETMYGIARRITPEIMEAVAAQLFVEQLKGGYTAVGEFHYVHHQPSGQPYAEPAEMALRVAAAARTAGIGLTLLPVLYQTSDFGGKEAKPEQRRFVCKTDQFLALHASLAAKLRADPTVRIGIAPHSLRAVTPQSLADAVLAVTQKDSTAPVHIHVAEQRKEVEGCKAWSGLRPVEWLLRKAPVGPRWCFVHATHLSELETQQLAQSEIVVGLCPTTEANLGDGLFPGVMFWEHGGRFGIGSDSQITVNAGEELRLLEYGQRLSRRKRAQLATDKERSVGAALWRRALAGGAQALSRPVGAIAKGKRADLLVLDGQHPTLIDKVDDLVLDTLVFAGNG